MVILRVVTHTSKQAKIHNFQSPSSRESAIFMMTSQGKWFAELTHCKCKFMLYSSSIPAQKRSHIIASTMPKTMGCCGDKGSNCSDRFQVASTTKQTLKESQRDCAHSSGMCLPEIQRGLDWRRFLDGCPRERRFPVAIVTKWSSRTLLDSWPLEVRA